jgi:hypothetical protein
MPDAPNAGDGLVDELVWPAAGCEPAEDVPELAYVGLLDDVEGELVYVEVLDGAGAEVAALVVDE